MLKIQLIGNIGKDAEIRKAGNMSAIGFNIATSKKVKGENVTTWVKCTKWVNEGGSLAVADYLKKGTKVYVSGEAGVEVYEGKGSLTCRVNEIEFCGGGEQSGAGPVKQHDTVDYPAPSDPFAEPAKVVDDLPF